MDRKVREHYNIGGSPSEIDIKPVGKPVKTTRKSKASEDENSSGGSGE